MIVGASRHELEKCREGYGCTGPGCRVSTGKTKRKANYARPKFNQHESSRMTVRAEKTK